MSQRIKGTILFEAIGPGCWGIKDAAGQIWRIVNMPEQLKYPGQEVRVRLREAEEEMSIFMWGTPAEILSFETI